MTAVPVSHLDAIGSMPPGLLYPHQADGVAFLISKKRAILAGWLGKRVVAQSVNGLDRVEFDAYDASVHFASDAALKAALDRLIMPKERSLRSRNVTIDGDFAHPEPVAAYAGAGNYELLCRIPRGAPSGATLPPPLFSYGSLLDADNSIAASTMAPATATKANASTSRKNTVQSDTIAMAPPKSHFRRRSSSRLS